MRSNGPTTDTNQNHWIRFYIFLRFLLLSSLYSPEWRDSYIIQYIGRNYSDAHAQRSRALDKCSRTCSLFKSTHYSYVSTYIICVHWKIYSKNSLRLSVMSSSDIEPFLNESTHVWNSFDFYLPLSMSQDAMQAIWQILLQITNNERAFCKVCSVYISDNLQST